MVLEATILCIDNSEFARNGDYAPSRWESQQDAANLICGAKTQQNPENCVGLMTMAGARVDVLVTPTTDIGKMLTALHGVKIGGKSDLVSAVNVAQLALKHRQNKNQRQRVVVFVGSPVAAEESALVALGKKLKKFNVAIDVVSFGEIDENTGKLEALVNAANSSDNSHILSIPPGPHVLSDILLSSPIVVGEEGAAAAAAGGSAGGAAGGFEFGVDPNMDPELAMALRISMEEERARQERSAGAAAGSDAARPSGDVEMRDAAAAPSAGAGGAAPMAVDDEEALLQRAIQMSMLEAMGSAGGASGDVVMRDATAPASAPAAATPAPAAPAPAAAAAPGGQVFQDPAFVQQLLAGLPGVDPNDERIRAVLAQMQGGAPAPKPEEQKKQGEDKK